MSNWHVVSLVLDAIIVLLALKLWLATRTASWEREHLRKHLTSLHNSLWKKDLVDP